MDVEQYLRRSRSGATLLCSDSNAGTPVEVHEYGGERWIYTGEGSVLSLMRLDAPADPVMPNHIAMLAAMLLVDRPQSVLNLGFGTGAFERFFQDRLPDTTVVSVDTSSMLVELARKYFAVRPDWPVVIRPAEEFLNETKQRFDLILCDIFQGDRHPDCLMDAGFHARAAQCLAPGGVMAFNLSPATEQALLDILLPMRRSFRHVLLVDLVDYGNIVVYALQHAPLGAAEQHKRAEQLSRQLRLELTHIPDRVSALPAMKGGG
ncbi:MAG: methyltransferase domain-containing protein [Gammaproteobacteria bacterium]